MCSPFFHFNNHLEQLYVNNKTEHFDYKGGCGICVLRCLKEELAWDTDKLLRVISKIMLFKTVIPVRI